MQDTQENAGNGVAKPPKWPADRVARWEIGRLRPRPNNPMQHPPEQLEQIAASMRRWGWTNPVLVDESGEIIAGHGRVLAALSLGYQEAPVMVATDWTEDEKRAYVIADNKLAQNGEWDEPKLRVELDALAIRGFDVELIGFNPEELRALRLEPPPSGPGVEPDLPAVPAVPVSSANDVWILGPHRLMCGDATNAAHVSLLMANQRAQLLHADPPYGMGKENLGVQNDNLYGAKLDEFQLAWWRAARPHLDGNASAYIWGKAPDLWRLWWRAGLGDLEPVTLRNEIVWDKGSIAGMRSEDLTQYPEASERCLFFQLGRHVLLINQTKDDYWEGWEPLRVWLCEERDRAGFTAGEIKRICENHMYGHWFGRSQWVFITQENYEKLAAAANGRAFSRPYADLFAEYRDLARVFNGEVKDPRTAEFLAARPYFDNAHEIMRDTWEFARVKGEERYGHATPKPVPMMERIMRSSARENALVFEPFAGTGSTIMGAERSRRRCFAMELEPGYCDVAVERWEHYAGQDARLESTGETFKQVKSARA